MKLSEVLICLDPTKQMQSVISVSSCFYSQHTVGVGLGIMWSKCSSGRHFSHMETTQEIFYVNSLIFSLTAIAESEVGDVREVLDYYRTFEDPLAAFRENQRKAHEQEMVLSQKAEEERQQRSFASSWTSSFLRRR